MEISDNDFIETSQPVSIDHILESLKVTTHNAAHITSDLSIVMESIREGKGTLGKLLMDTVLADNVDRALVTSGKVPAGSNKTWIQQAKVFFCVALSKRKKKHLPKRKIRRMTKTKSAAFGYADCYSAT